jgi:hypothetical protein
LRASCFIDPSKVSTTVEGAIRKRLAAGEGLLKVAKLLGVGVSTVQRIRAEMPAAAVRVTATG